MFASSAITSISFISHAGGSDLSLLWNRRLSLQTISNFHFLGTFLLMGWKYKWKFWMVLLFIEFSNSPTKLPWHIPLDTIIKLQSNKKGTRNLIEKAQDSMNCAAFCDRLSASMQHREIVSHSHAGEIVLILCKKCIFHSGDNNIRGGGGGGQFPCWAWVEGGLVSSCPIFF